MTRPEAQPAYVLHSRAYRETGAIVDFLTRERGRISLSSRRLQPDPWSSTVADLKVGDVMPTGPGQGFTVKSIEPNRQLLLVVDERGEVRHDEARVVGLGRCLGERGVFRADRTDLFRVPPVEVSEPGQ